MANAAPTLIRTARRRSGLSQADLARRAGMPRSVVNAYERGTREPGADALARLVAAAACDVSVVPTSGIDLDRAGRLLSQVLDLAESLPFRRSRTLGGPTFLERIG
ncbi:MAG TPA: helix-turn-helix transcriptional regulator [Acidimicrobiales bacterium]|jgi:uncharacterized protein|nr:helix-turn-helix transcriptional regulator [Acidimicrobiales bacterium]